MNFVYELVSNLNFSAGTFLVNVAATVALNFGIYFRRYHDKELVVTSSLFNIFIFFVLTTLSAANIGVSAGFGLFAFLAMFTMRSEQLTKSEMTYLFGSVAIAVVCAVSGHSLINAALTVSLIVVAVYLIDHPHVLSQFTSTKVTLDRIDLELLNNPPEMRKSLSNRLGVSVMNFQVTQLDYINDMVKLNVYFRQN
jgi:hypothetical protein